MKKIQQILLYIYFIPITLAIIWAIINENDLFELVGIAHTNANADFMITACMEIITLLSIPVALKWLRFDRIKKLIHQDRQTSLQRFCKQASFRMILILIPLLLNTILYYLFMNVAFGYMAIIGLIVSFFIFPSHQRCIDEYLNTNK